MILAAALMLGAEPPKSADQDYLVSFFLDTCTRGSGRVEAGAVSESRIENTPYPIQKWYKDVKDTKVTAIKRESPAFLVQFEQTPVQHDDFKSGCAVISNKVDFHASIVSVMETFNYIVTPSFFNKAKKFYKNGVEEITFNPEGVNYMVRFIRIGDGYVVMQTAFLNDLAFQKKLRREEKARKN